MTKDEKVFTHAKYNVLNYKFLLIYKSMIVSSVTGNHFINKCFFVVDGSLFLV